MGALPSSKSFSLCGWLDHRRKTSSPAALIWRLGVDFPRTRLQPKDPKPAFIFGAAAFSGGSTPMCSALKCVILLPTFIKSCVKLHLCCCSNLKAMGYYENYKSV